jgi:polar amino acid transport system permease protein
LNLADRQASPTASFTIARVPSWRVRGRAAKACAKHGAMERKHHRKTTRAAGIGRGPGVHRLMGYQWSFGFLWHYERLFVVGVEVTLAYTFGTIGLGLVIGLLIGMAKLSKSWLVNAPLIALTEVFRCTPLLVQIVWFYYALPVILNIQIPATVAAVAVLSLYTGAFYAEIFRGGIISIEPGQWDAARALGLRRWPMMRKVILPQAVRRMVPPFVNQSITQLKNTSLVSTIAVPDLLYQGQLITADTYRPLETYTAVAVIYFILLFPTTLAAQAYERRLARK